MISPSSAPLGPLPPWPLFHFLSAASLENARIRVGVGGQGTIGMVISEARRSGVFSSNPIPSRILTPSWLMLNWARRKGWCEVLEASSGSSCW